MGNPNHDLHPPLDLQAGPSLRATVTHAIFSAVIIWTILINVICFFVPIDSTGSPEGDAINDAKVPWVLAATTFGTVSLTALQIARWRRKKKLENNPR